MPSIANISPADLSTLDNDDPVSFEVTSTTRTLVAVEFASLRLVELVYDGDNFMPLYSATSTVSVAGSTKTFSILRQPLWPEAPKFRVFAFDGGTEL